MYSKRHGFTATSTGPKINLTVENTPKEYFKLFLTENLVQGFADEANTYANNSIVSKQLSPCFISSTWKDVRVTEFWCFLATVIINMGIIGLPYMNNYWSYNGHIMYHFSITYFQETDLCKYFGCFSFPPHHQLQDH
jgi:hypothetical protein